MILSSTKSCLSNQLYRNDDVRMDRKTNNVYMFIPNKNEQSKGILTFDQSK